MICISCSFPQAAPELFEEIEMSEKYRALLYRSQGFFSLL
jgi:hypothetical protein